jgi:hypothetical protein
VGGNGAPIGGGGGGGGGGPGIGAFSVGLSNTTVTREDPAEMTKRPFKNNVFDPIPPQG